MINSIVLRQAGIDDVPAIMEIETPVFGHEAWSTEAMARDVADRNCFYLVAEAHTDALGGDPLVVGYAGLLAPRGSGDGDIQTIAIHPDFRSHGLGRRLMEALLEEAEALHARRIFLEVRADNPHAIALYASLGFEEIAVRPGYYQPEGVDAVIMKKGADL
ncbi:ribosomal protein S18-alanine N-acetyltransferase [Aurantimicrobium sp. MWH-Uga1]|uniref:ribosomal protein S18-alanine N-acetyltransferase n=1 Tax=Aurantimicrobium sp. MWH-Uga1 TaxID=2079575 RepID=UPI000DEDDDB1|nr:ribosomal protein S18-alanine N-acetyltransferase [Aurantimicrobium sp. MWH-Uga1]AXE53916.1 Protease synthase and sporulation negative regulatory protein PAI 1 [Aurantimicrobium sp. MWH-Uga1]